MLGVAAALVIASCRWAMLEACAGMPQHSRPRQRTSHTGKEVLLGVVQTLSAAPGCQLLVMLRFSEGTERKEVEQWENVMRRRRRMVTMPTRWRMTPRSWWRLAAGRDTGGWPLATGVVFSYRRNNPVLPQTVQFIIIRLSVQCMPNAHE